MRIEIQLDEEQAEKLAQLQQQTQQNQEVVIKQAIDAYHQQLQYPSKNAIDLFEQVGFIGCDNADPQQLDERKKTPFEAFQEAGLIGCINAEPDLSVNYKEKVYEYLREKHRQGRL